MGPAMKNTLVRRLVFGLTFLLVNACVTTPDVKDTVEPAKATTLLLDNDALTRLRAEISRSGQSATRKLIEADARHRMKCASWSVTLKDGTPPSGDKHDFMTMAPYWWPNPATKDGFPYIKRDGETNPEVKRFGDEQALNSMTCVEQLSFGAFVLNERQAGDKAVSLLQTWSLNAETRMNPNMRFAEGIPGKTVGRGIGINAGRVFLRVIDSALLLRDAGFLREADDKALRRWFGEYLDWLLTSPEGRSIADESNNIGLIYDAQIASAALFSGREDVARRVLADDRIRLVRDQIEPDGKQPAELERNRAWHYSC